MREAKNESHFREREHQELQRSDCDNQADLSAFGIYVYEFRVRGIPWWPYD